MLELIEISFYLLSPILFLTLPLLSFIILIFFGKSLKEKSSHIALSLIGLMFLSSLFLLLTTANSTTEVNTTFDWFSTGNFNVQLGLYLDNITIIDFLLEFKAFSKYFVLIKSSLEHSQPFG